MCRYREWTAYKSELSGSWRIINPVTGNALRLNGNKVEVGENNGSDEAQLWKYENGLLIPTNSPNYALAKGQGGTLVVIKKETALTHKAAQFRFEVSKYAGFDDNLTYPLGVFSSQVAMQHFFIILSRSLCCCERNKLLD